MTKHLKKSLRKAARARPKPAHKGLSRRPVRRSSKSEGGSCAAAKAGWSAERRARQAEVIRASQPWKKSTGPQTSSGKARIAANALKRGFRSRAFIERVRQERQLIHDAASTIALAKLVLGPRGACPPAALRADRGARSRGTLLRAMDSRGITVWTAEPLDAPDLILTALGHGPDGSEHTGARSGE